MNEPLRTLLWLRDYNLSKMEETIRERLFDGLDPEDNVVRVKDVESALR